MPTFSLVIHYFMFSFSTIPSSGGVQVLLIQASRIAAF